jgi:microcin C transport system ATP-binding protein
VTTLLEIKDLSVHFETASGLVKAVENVSIRVNKGETVAIVGESGSGKSVTALSVMQLLPYPRASHPTGSILFNGEEVVGATPETLKRVRGDQIGMIFQEPMTSLNPLHTVQKQISETLILHKGLSESESRAKCLELLHLVRIRDPEQRLDSYPHQLSGGQRQRVMIAMALANEPDLLIADEPTTALDVTTQAQILKLLEDLQKDLGMAVLLITHDLGIVRKVSDRVYIMQQGRVVEEGLTKEIYANPSQAYTRELLSAEPPQKPQRDVSGNEVIMQGENIRVWFPINRGVFKKTVGHIKAADDVSFSVRAGETLGIVGESGSGKTTLAQGALRLINSTGNIRFKGQSIHNLQGKDLKDVRRQMQIVFQDPYGSLSPRLSVKQIVEEGLEAHNMGNAEEREQLVIAALEETGLDPSSRFRYPHEFSGGQRQRIAIARAMIMKPQLVVLDEPTSALDRPVQVQIVDLLLKLQAENDLAFIFISHDLKIVRALSDQIIVMRNGKVIEQGNSDKIFDNPEDPYTKALISAAFDLVINDESAIEQ